MELKQQKLLINILKFIVIFTFILIAKFFLYPTPQSDEWRILSPARLMASSQTEVRDLVRKYKIDEPGLSKILKPLKLTVDNFKKSVVVSFILDHQSKGKYGVIIVFHTEIEHELLLPAYDFIANDVLSQFKTLKRNSNGTATVD
ncbi:hypothetical protein ACRN9C_02580 [Shewanella frigidimarina]|uniref:hypothetical protein n=1 Tax=Shewanella frigidimarina TaxID=56812 RepID=UPI003D7A17C4